MKTPKTSHQMSEPPSSSSIKRLCIKFLIFLLLIALLPFIFLGVVLLMCYRTAVKYAAKLFRKDLSSMVTTIGNVLAGDNRYETPKSNVVALLVIEGNLDSENTKEALIKNALEPKDGVARYPELKQYLVKWCGYHFWKTDRNFNLDNHYKIIDDDKFRTEEDLKSICEVNVNKKWVRKRPLWELTIIKNYIPSHSSISETHTAIIWRSHHSLADGYSLLYFLTETLGQDKVVIPKPDIFSRGFLQKLTYCIQLPVKVLWELCELFVMGVSETYSLSTPKGDFTSKDELHTNISPFIPIWKVKDVKKHYGTSFAAVQFAALGGALQEFHLKRNLPLLKNYPCFTVLPHVGHKLYKFRNYMGTAQTYLPTSESDPYKRLMQSHRDYNRIKKSTFPLASFYVYSLTGCNIRKVVKWILQHHVFPIGLTSFPGPQVQRTFLGHNAVDVLVWAGPNEGLTGTIFTLVSYVDGFRISATARSSVMTKDEVTEITNLFVHHIDELHQMASLDEKKATFQIA